MEAEAGPSGAGDAADPEEMQEFPFPDPDVRPMALCDLLGFASEAEAAAGIQDGKHTTYAYLCNPKASCRKSSKKHINRWKSDSRNCSWFGLTVHDLLLTVNHAVCMHGLFAVFMLPLCCCCSMLQSGQMFR